MKEGNSNGFGFFPMNLLVEDILNQSLYKYEYPSDQNYCSSFIAVAHNSDAMEAF